MEWEGNVMPRARNSMTTQDYPRTTLSTGLAFTVGHVPQDAENWILEA